MFQEIIINRSVPNLRKMLSQISSGALSALLRMPDASREGATPFLLACLSGNLSMCTYLLELGADVFAKTSRCESFFEFFFSLFL
jgi:ankyrin repeat protein